jgi:nucleosome assembly protein 1-like 1
LELLAPLYARRHDIIEGKAIPTTEEIEAGEKQSVKDDDEYIHLPKDSTATSAIPEFWLTALRNHIGLSEIITDRDAEALKHLLNIRLEYLPKDSPDIGFKILFEFSPNAYFENQILEKTYIYQTEVGYEGNFMYDRAIGTTIKWKEDKDLTKEYEIKKQRNKSTCEDLSLVLTDSSFS